MEQTGSDNLAGRRALRRADRDVILRYRGYFLVCQNTGRRPEAGVDLAWHAWKQSGAAMILKRRRLCVLRHPRLDRPRTQIIYLMKIDVAEDLPFGKIVGGRPKQDRISEPSVDSVGRCRGSSNRGFFRQGTRQTPSSSSRCR